MKYKLIASPDFAEFERKVNMYLKAGWILHGTTNVTYIGTTDIFCIYSQAAIYTDKPISI